jgi:translation initiation factor IF-2
MSDPESSGAETPAAEAVNPPSAPTNSDLPPSTFGNTRGSGLARGKRPVSPPPQAAPAASAAEYKPTAVSILTAPTEYKNPFAPPAPPAPPAEAPAPEANAPVPAPLPAAEVAAPPAAPADETPPPAGEPAPAAAPEPESKSELKILPPETTKRVEHNWESQSFRNVAGQARGDQGRPADAPFEGGRPRRDDRRGDRPVFRPDRDRRGDRPADARAAGESGRNVSGEYGRPESYSPARPEAFSPATPEAPRKSGGFFGWLKRLFSGSAAKPETPPAETRGGREFDREGHRHDRRHRGGRNRHFRGGDQRGPRDGQFGGQPSGDQRGPGGDNFNSGQRRRRRHRGGGGYRGEGGYRGDSRPEGGPPSGS